MKDSRSINQAKAPAAQTIPSTFSPAFSVVADILGTSKASGAAQIWKFAYLFLCEISITAMNTNSVLRNSKYATSAKAVGVRMGQ